MMKILMDNKIKKYNLQKKTNYIIEYCTIKNISNKLRINVYNAILLTGEYDNIIFNLRSLTQSKCPYIVIIDDKIEYSLCADLLIKNKLNDNSSNNSIKAINDFLSPNSKHKIARYLKKLLITADSDLETQLYRVPIITKFIIDCIVEEKLFNDDLNKNFIKDTIYYSSIHDFGKLAIESDILNYTGIFSKEQMEQMKKHTTLGLQMYKNFSTVYPELDSKYAHNIIYYHHEKYDGTGYPEGLRENEIPLEARIVAVADVYDALRSNRKYKKSMSHDVSFEILIDGKGKHFDPYIISALSKYEKEFEVLYHNLAKCDEI